MAWRKKLDQIRRFAFARKVDRFPVDRVDGKLVAKASDRSYGELLTPPDHRAMVWRWWLLEGETIEVHWHPAAEMILMISGQLRVTDGSEITAGETVAYQASQPHAVTAVTDCEYFVVFQPGVYIDVSEEEAHAGF